MASAGAPSQLLFLDAAPTLRDLLRPAGTESLDAALVATGFTAPPATSPALNLAASAPAAVFDSGSSTASDSGSPAPQAPASGGGAPAGSSASTGFGFSMLLACLAALLSVAFQQFSKLRIRPAQSPSALFVAVLERPG
jgi:hypothetical protein